MYLNQELIEAYKLILLKPESAGFKFKPLTECFDKSTIAVPKHILFKFYLDYIQKPLPKVMFYLIMDELYASCVGRAPTGEGGYYLTLKTTLQ